MSERAAAAGKDGPPITVEYNGKTYIIQPVLTERVMLAIENEMYEREKKALASQRDIMDKDTYEKYLAELRVRYINGDFDFESEYTMNYMKTKAGAITVLSYMVDCSKAELIELLTKKPVEMQDALALVLALSMPKDTEIATSATSEGVAETPKVVRPRSRRGR